MTQTTESTTPSKRVPAGRRPRSLWPPLAVLLAGVAVLVLVGLDGPDTPRAIAVVAYVAVIPGLACARLIPIRDALTQVVIGVALSLALGILVAQTMLTLGRWSPVVGVGVLAGMGSIAALLELVRAARRGSRRAAT